MAARADSESHPKLSVTTPHQISADFQGSGNSIPLSPQWLLPKAGEAKGTEDSNCNLQPVNGNLSDTLKALRVVEVMHDMPMKKSVFRPSIVDVEADKRDRWRDEERDTNSSFRKDRWKDGDKDFGDNRKADRWIENSSNRNFGESRRDRRMDSSNLNSNFDQRRESKWNTRWGPDDKEPEGLRENWVDSEKDGDLLHDKGFSHDISHGKDDKEGNQYRPWRSASSQSRVRGGPHQSITPSKQFSTFSYGHGRGENTPPTLSVSRGRSGSIGSSNIYSNPTHSITFGLLGDKFEGSQGEPYTLKYARTKLLDVYRTSEVRSCQSIPVGFVPVPSLTLEEPLEPLALCIPNPEEMVVLNGIDIGDVISSGAPQISKDGRPSLDIGHARRDKLADREDLPQEVSEGTKVSPINFSDGLYERQMQFHGSQMKMETSQDCEISAGHKLKAEAFRDDGNHTQADIKELIFQKNISVHPGVTWKTLSIGENKHSSVPDWIENPNDVSFRTPERLSQSSKNLTNESGISLANQMYTKDNIKCQIGDDPIIRRQLGIFGEEQRLRKPIQSSPEDLRLYYQDPSGVIQGPFTGIDIIGWFEAGYFGLDLLVRLESAPTDSPFSALGDVMPHLRAKAKPPPGFGGSKQIEHVDASTNLSSSGFPHHHSGLSEMELVINETKHKHGSATEAENKFLESLMSANLRSSSFENSSFSEGVPLNFGNTSHNFPISGVDGGNDPILIAKRMAMERQKSLPNIYQYWQGRDPASMVPKSEFFQDPRKPLSNLLTPILDNPRQTPFSQNVDMMSGISDGSSSGINNVGSNWSNFTSQCISDTLQSKMGMQHDPNLPTAAPFGLQQQRFQPQNLPSYNNQFPQAMENPSERIMSSNLSQEQQLLNILQQQQLLPSKLPQDPQVLNMFQQQYLLQLYSQASAPTQQISLLDKLLLLNQQQKQEEQLQLLRQQQLLSHVLSAQQSHQQTVDPSYGQVNACPVPLQSALTDPSRIQPSPEMLHDSSRLPILSVQGEHVGNFGDRLMLGPRDVIANVSLEGSSVTVPHQIFGTQQRSMDAAFSTNDIHLKEMLAVSKMVESSSLPNIISRSTEHADLIDKDVSAEIIAPKSIDHNTTLTLDVDGEPEAGIDSELVSSGEAFVVCVTDSNLEVKRNLESAYEKLEVERDVCSHGSAKVEVENIEIREPKKVSEKKSKKQKSVKLQPSSDQGKGIAKSIHSKPESDELKLVSEKSTEQSLLHKESGNESKKILSSEAKDPPQIQSSMPETVGIKSDTTSSQTQTGQRAWKPAPGFKAKSLLEIQEEEQKKAQTETVVSEISTSVKSISLSTSWTGIVGNLGETQKRQEASINSKAKKSQLHDLLDEEGLPKFSEGDNEVSDALYKSSSVVAVNKHSESINDEQFIEAKETKKSRKKAAKAKGVGTKASSPITYVDIPTNSSPIEKVKSSRQVQQEKEVIPTIPSGPSLSDFVFLKGAESGNSSLAPAWSTDSGKSSKPTSLRDIQKEQERRISSQHPSQMPTSQKSQPTQISRSNVPSWSVSASSPSKVASPISSFFRPSSQSRNKGDEDLFWGPADNLKQESQQADFPQLANQSSWETIPSAGKGTSIGSLGRQKSLNGKASDIFQSASASVQSSLRVKRDARTNHSEAIDFRDWCESECIRLIGSKDTSFLEFCLKQSRSEAELLLTENLGSYDPGHEFIDKFLNYKELLSAEVLESAFQTRNDLKATGFGAKDVSSKYANSGNADANSTLTPDGTSKGGGKKKGKKGKKVSAEILGFNVVSNRIMMGEIQNVED